MVHIKKKYLKIINTNLILTLTQLNFYSLTDLVTVLEAKVNFR